MISSKAFASFACLANALLAVCYVFVTSANSQSNTDDRAERVIRIDESSFFEYSFGNDESIEAKLVEVVKRGTSTLVRFELADGETTLRPVEDLSLRSRRRVAGFLRAAQLEQARESDSRFVWYLRADSDEPFVGDFLFLNGEGKVVFDTPEGVRTIDRNALSRQSERKLQAIIEERPESFPIHTLAENLDANPVFRIVYRELNTQSKIEVALGAIAWLRAVEDFRLSVVDDDVELAKRNAAELAKNVNAISFFLDTLSFKDKEIYLRGRQVSFDEIFAAVSASILLDDDSWPPESLARNYPASIEEALRVGGDVSSSVATSDGSTVDNEMDNERREDESQPTRARNLLANFSPEESPNVKGAWRKQANTLIFIPEGSDGGIEIPVAVPREFTLSVQGTPSNLYAGQCLALYLQLGESLTIVQLAEDGSCVIAEGVDPRASGTARYGQVFQEDGTNEIIYTVSVGKLTVSVNGDELLSYNGDDVGKHASDKIYFGVTGDWEFESIELDPTSD